VRSMKNTRSSGLEMLKGLENAHAVQFKRAEPIIAVSRGPFRANSGGENYPGTSCLALSCCPSGTKYILPAEPFMKLALSGLKLWAKSSSPVGASSPTRPPNFAFPY
jgi:hypothetical protein